MALGAFLLSLSMMTGCQLFREIRVAEPGPAYPDTLPRGEVVDIQVFRQITRLQMTNSTPRTFGPGTLWVNQQYSIPVGQLAPGESMDLDLETFVDEFGDTFRAGGFFAQRDPAAVVLVEIEQGEPERRELVGFIVVENAYF